MSSFLRLCLGCAAWTAVLSLSLTSPALAAPPGESPEQRDARMGWWREAKFGMFVHWGLYSVPAGYYRDQPVENYGEWIMHFGKIPVAEYELFTREFNPVRYDAREWVRIAQQAGMRYIVITSKHHDGFALWNSEISDYDIAATQYERDLLKELADACHESGLRLGFYHSILDWHHPAANREQWPQYRDYLQTQVSELLTNYGPIDMLWFDGEWIEEWDRAQGAELEAYARSLQPEIIINNRVGKRTQEDGDFGTPEQEIPATGIPGHDWETCMTINDTWGFKRDDENWKPTQVLLHNLIDIVSKGGNFLLNVGPTAQGEIPPESVERLAEMGAWLEIHGQAIYGTQPSPFAHLDWGRCTSKPGLLYLHVFDWPTDGRLHVPGLRSEVVRASLLGGDGQPLKVQATEAGVVVRVPAEATNPIASVVVLEIADERALVDTE